MTTPAEEEIAEALEWASTIHLQGHFPIEIKILAAALRLAQTDLEDEQLKRADWNVVIEDLQKKVKELEAERDKEAWYHAACLSIAEGVEGWHYVHQPSIAVSAVQRLRDRMEQAEQKLIRVEAALKA